MHLFNLLIFILVLNPFDNGDVQHIPNDSMSKEVKVIEIEGNDQMKFDITEIKAKAGEEIKVILTTKSNLPKVAMAHNIIFLNQSADVEEFVSASSLEKNNDYIASEYEDQIIAASDLAGGGESVEVIFTVPEQAGEYDFICSFPGHYTAGMKGTLVVENS